MESRNHDPKNGEPWGYDPKGFYPRKCGPGDIPLKAYHRKSVQEELREAGYLPRENDWTQTGPLAPLWKLPYPLNMVVLTPVLAVLLFLAISYLAWSASHRTPRRRP